ncbi:WxL domain-containing protein [Ligilactobacillus equi]|uniref:WxL domain-containing protein n=1 Tax=Ligilactobacillus equi DPC 6820 TaxID=1392007 RepID=V7HWX4_9LACO|nr:WxL domain-containing protein [Ligilactobacillus equi]ETA73536.1 hypothetical protein LEQ_1481 [Ligilactobacillus equi DPC 6820]
MRKLSRQITLLATTLLASASLNTPIFAADTSSSSQTISGQVKSGSLTMSASFDTTSPEAQTLTGTSNLQFTTGGGKITITDARGTGAGYKLSVSATPLSFENTQKISAASTYSSSISSISANIKGVVNASAANDDSTSMGEKPTVVESIANFVSLTGTGATIATANNTQQGADNTQQGMGSFVITLPTYTFTIPAKAYAGTYSSTITYTLSDSPD